jgi:hypothetical protein
MPRNVLLPFCGALRRAQIYEVTSSSFIALALIMLDATLTFSGGSLFIPVTIRPTLQNMNQGDKAIPDELTRDPAELYSTVN